MTQLPYEVVFLVQSLCGAVILLSLDIWLRQKEVRDPVLIWLYISLLSWCARGAVWIVHSKSPSLAHLLPEDQIQYIFSPVSSVLFTMAAFRLARVRDLLQRHSLQGYANVVKIFVILISAAALILLLAKQDDYAKGVDSIASMVALIGLGLGLGYSFHIYGNKYLIALTGITFVGFIGRQFYQATHPILPDWIAPFFLANSMMLIMLFIALAIAWGVSAISGIKPSGKGIPVNIITMFFDLRGSTRWSTDEVGNDVGHVSNFIDELLEWSWTNFSPILEGRPNLVKFLGDGFMFVWEIPDYTVIASANTVIASAYKNYSTYPLWTEELRKTLPWATPNAIGVGVDVGHAVRLTFENGSHDYLGSPVNIAAKMQNVARPNGGVVIKESVWQWLTEMKQSFPMEGTLQVGKTAVPIRATEAVEDPMFELGLHRIEAG